MPVKDIFKISRKTFFDPAGWIGYNELKAYNKIIWSQLRALATPAAAQRMETFEQAMERLNLTEADVEKTAQQYLIYAIIFVILAALAFAAGFVLLIAYGTFFGWVLAMASTAIVLSQAFRFHFWHFQIKHRKLGCTFQEWWKGDIAKDKESP